MSKDIYFGLPAGQIAKMKEMYIGLPSAQIGRVKSIYAGLSGGVIGHIFQNALVINITTNVKNVNLSAWIGTVTSSVNVILNIFPGVVVFSDVKNQPSMYFSSNLPSGSLLTINNAGIIYGQGGDGGDFVSYNNSTMYNFVDPEHGDTALSLGCNTEINNVAGGILGGGGGGGVCLYNTGSWPGVPHLFSGGGGAGYSIGLLGYMVVPSANPHTVYGEDGTYTTGGRGRYYRGDNWPNTSLTTLSKGGDSGQNGAKPANQGDDYVSSITGLGGKAISKNGFSLAWLGSMGNVKGAVS